MWTHVNIIFIIYMFIFSCRETTYPWKLPYSWNRYFLILLLYIITSVFSLFYHDLCFYYHFILNNSKIQLWNPISTFLFQFIWQMNMDQVKFEKEKILWRCRTYRKDYMSCTSGDQIWQLLKQLWCCCCCLFNWLICFTKDSFKLWNFTIMDIFEFLLWLYLCVMY